MFKNDSLWKCSGCYAANKSDVVKCACCGGLKLGATEPSKSGEKALSASIGKISFGVSSNEKAGGGDSPIVLVVVRRLRRKMIKSRLILAIRVCLVVVVVV